MHVSEEAEQPCCCMALVNPDPGGQEVKKRVELDMSRRVYGFQDVQLGDLLYVTATKAMRCPGDHISIFDLGDSICSFKADTYSQGIFLIFLEGRFRSDQNLHANHYGVQICSDS